MAMSRDNGFAMCFAGGIFAGCDNWSEQTKRACFDAVSIYFGSGASGSVVWQTNNDLVSSRCIGREALERVGKLGVEQYGKTRLALGQGVVGGDDCILCGCKKCGGGLKLPEIRIDQPAGSAAVGNQGVGSAATVVDGEVVSDVQCDSDVSYLTLGASSGAVSSEDKFLIRSVERKTDGLGCPDSISVSQPVSEKTLANREKRAKKKERKLRKRAGGQSERPGVDVSASDVPEWRKHSNPFGALSVDRADSRRSGGEYRGAFSNCSEETRKQLAETRARRLIAENRASAVQAEASEKKAQNYIDNWDSNAKAIRKRNNLKSLQVDQKIELTRCRDLEKIKKRDEVRVMRDTETSKVAVERAFGTLAGTGNIPSLVGGTVQTIVSGSISPNSSISEAEVRKLQKEFLDITKQKDDLKKQNEELIRKLSEFKVGVDNDVAYSVGITVDDEGNPIGDLGDEYGGYIGADGRFHQGEDYANWY